MVAVMKEVVVVLVGSLGGPRLNETVLCRWFVLSGGRRSRRVSEWRLQWRCLRKEALNCAEEPTHRRHLQIHGKEREREMAKGTHGI